MRRTEREIIMGSMGGGEISIFHSILSRTYYYYCYYTTAAQRLLLVGRKEAHQKFKPVGLKYSIDW